MYKVLIADDENKACQLIRALGDWERFEFEVVGVCNDGEDAYNQILKYRPDVVITDIRMPVYDGLQLIEKVKAAGLEPSFVIISGYRHFEYARNALRFGIADYLLKPIDQQQLNEVLEKIHRQLKQKEKSRQKHDRADQILRNEYRSKQVQFLQDIMDGNFNGELLQLNEQDMKKRYEFEVNPQGCFLVMLLNVENQDLLEDGGLFEQKAESLFAQSFSYCQYAITSKAKRGIWCAIYYDGAKRERIKESVKEFYNSIQLLEEIYGEFRPVLGVGTEETETSRFWVSFRCAGEAEWRKMAYQGMKIHYYSEMPQCSVFSKEQLTKQFRSLYQALELMQPDEVKQWFSMIRTYAGEAAEKLQAEYEIRGQIIEVFGNYLETIEADCAEQLVGRMEEHSYRCGNLKALWDYLEQEIVVYLERYAAEKAAGDGKPILLVKRYVESHLGDCITMEDMARLAGFAPSYFSNIFKRQTGQNFSEYLTEVRMHEAKKLLRNSDKTIGEIAVLTGYPDDKYFRKLFKRLVGIKASEYRKLYH